MASKNISLTEEAYKYLKMLKGKNKSFSDVVLKMKEAERKGTGKDLLKFAGFLKDVDWEEREKRMKSFRESFSKRVREAIKYREES